MSTAGGPSGLAWEQRVRIGAGMYPLRAALLRWSCDVPVATGPSPAAPVSMCLLLLQSPMAVQRLRAASALGQGLVVTPLGRSATNLHRRVRQLGEPENTAPSSSPSSSSSPATGGAVAGPGSSLLFRFSRSERMALRHAAASAPTPLATLSVLERAAAAEVATGGGVLSVGLPESLARRLDRVAKGAVGSAVAAPRIGHLPDLQALLREGAQRVAGRKNPLRGLSRLAVAMGGAREGASHGGAGGGAPVDGAGPSQGQGQGEHACNTVWSGSLPQPAHATGPASLVIVSVPSSIPVDPAVATTDDLRQVARLVRAVGGCVPLARRARVLVVARAAESLGAAAVRNIGPEAAAASLEAWEVQSATKWEERLRELVANEKPVRLLCPAAGCPPLARMSLSPLVLADGTSPSGETGPDSKSAFGVRPVVLATSGQVWQEQFVLACVQLAGIEKE